jgi:hypothetical protein
MVLICAGDAAYGAGDRNTQADMTRSDLYLLKIIPLNSDRSGNGRSVGGDGYSCMPAGSGYGVDCAGDAAYGAGDRNTQADMTRNDLYLLKNIHLNSNH